MAKNWTIRIFTVKGVLYPFIKERFLRKDFFTE